MNSQNSFTAEPNQASRCLSHLCIGIDVSKAKLDAATILGEKYRDA